MTEPVFRDTKEVKVEAKSVSLWTLALNYVTGPVRIQMQVPVEDMTQWTYGSGKCGPGGTYDLSASAILPFAPIGALIAKVGGGDAECPGLPATSGAAPQTLPTSKLYAVGRYSVIEVKAGEGGPLFLTMNDDVKNFVNHGGVLTVKVAIAVG